MEEDIPRMVKTPWSDTEMPFEEAAEIGTRKVIAEHSTIGILVTTDGSITEISRNEYIEAEERVVRELKELNKPFVIVLNTNNPFGAETLELTRELEEKYGVAVIPTDCVNLNYDDVNNIFGKILYEFPIERINISLPGWVEGLSNEHDLKQQLYKEIKEAFSNIKTVKSVNNVLQKFKKTEIITKTSIEKIDLGTGAVTVEILLKEDLFYKIMTEITGIKIADEAELFGTIENLSIVKKEYDKISMALQEVKQKGYGIVMPSMEELILDEPEMVKQGSRFGVKLKAKAPSIHIERIKQKCKIPQKEKQYSNRNSLQCAVIYFDIREKTSLIKTVFFYDIILFFLYGYSYIIYICNL